MSRISFAPSSDHWYNDSEMSTASIVSPYSQAAAQKLPAPLMPASSQSKNRKMRSTPIFLESTRNSRSPGMFVAAPNVKALSNPHARAHVQSVSPSKTRIIPYAREKSGHGHIGKNPSGLLLRSSH